MSTAESGVAEVPQENAPTEAAVAPKAFRQKPVRLWQKGAPGAMGYYPVPESLLLANRT